jgi:hypothetical protein
MLIFAAFAIKTVYKTGYRQAEGAIEDYLDLQKIPYSHPNFRTIQWRVQRLQKEGINLMIHTSIDEENEYIDVIMDSTGAKRGRSGEYRRERYGGSNDWNQLHIAISRKTHKILNMKVTKAHAGDANQFVSMMEPIVNRKNVNSSRTDGGYDSEKNFEFCYKHNIKAIMPVHINAVGAKGKYRRIAIKEQLGFERRRGAHRRYSYPSEEKRRENQEMWKEKTNYHDRSLIETVNSVYKGVFGEYSFSRSVGMIEKELLLKAVVYNSFIA